MNSSNKELYYKYLKAKEFINFQTYIINKLVQEGKFSEEFLNKIHKEINDWKDNNTDENSS